VKELDGLASQIRGGGWILKKASFLENYIGTDYFQLCYIRGRRCYVCRTKQGRKTRALWGISWYIRICNVIAQVSR